MDAEYNGWPYQRGGPPGPPPELIPARAWVKSTHHAWFESATLATFGRLARALTKNVIFLFPKSKIDTTNRKGFPARASSPSAEGAGASALAQRFGGPQRPACVPPTQTHAHLDGARLAGTTDGPFILFATPMQSVVPQRTAQPAPESCWQRRRVKVTDMIECLEFRSFQSCELSFGAVYQLVVWGCYRLAYELKQFLFSLLGFVDKGK